MLDAKKISAELDFDKMQGLLPAVLQDADTGAVLMVGFMNREAVEKTLRTGYATFFSRTRNQLWMKGETSGNRARIESAVTDCDRDTLLLRVHVEGSGLICHEGQRSCFNQDVPLECGGAAKESGGEEQSRTQDSTKLGAKA